MDLPSHAAAVEPLSLSGLEPLGFATPAPCSRPTCLLSECVQWQEWVNAPIPSINHPPLIWAVVLAGPRRRWGSGGVVFHSKYLAQDNGPHPKQNTETYSWDCTYAHRCEFKFFSVENSKRRGPVPKYSNQPNLYPYQAYKRVACWHVDCSKCYLGCSFPRYLISTIIRHWRMWQGN